MAQLCQQKAELDRLGVEVLIISFGRPKSARKWLAETCRSFQMLLDPERVVYRAYGNGRSWLRSWNLRTLRRYVQLLAGGRKWRGIQGDSTQLGGDFVTDEDGPVLLVHRSQDPTDRPSVSDLLAVLAK